MVKATHRISLSFAIVLACTAALGSEAPAAVVEVDAGLPLHFFATADPQYRRYVFWRNGVRKKERASSNFTLHYLTTKVGDANDPHKFLAIAGDLTHNAGSDELDLYTQALSPNLRLVYDGLGNHDLRGNRRKHVLEFSLRPRISIAGRADEHYSWDYPANNQSVHFVQLNLYPGMDTDRDRTEEGDRRYLKPNDSLDFLRTDLQQTVGRSGRPVILFHHYGFDNFSLRWWSENERRTYWDVIADYNVVAIVTGHRHLRAAHTSWYRSWLRPADRTRGPSCIHTFVAGAALNAVFLDFLVNARARQLVVTRKAMAAVPPANCSLKDWLGCATVDMQFQEQRRVVPFECT